MHVISRDAPCYFLTSVAKGRLPVFKTEAIKVIACAALDEAKRPGAFALYSYVIMPDHLHVVTDPQRITAMCGAKGATVPLNAGGTDLMAPDV